MQRAEIVEDKKPLKIVSASLPPPPVHGARLKTVFAGVCHSDLHLIEDEFQIQPGFVLRNREIFPKLGGQFAGIVPGHEISGVIEEFGSEANEDNYGLKVGDFVILYPWIGCAKCSTCLVGCTQQCENSPGQFFSYGLGPVHGGGYSSHISAHKLDILIKMPESIPRHIACMLPCSGITAFAALKRASQFIQHGKEKNNVSKLLVIGAGGLGLWCIQIAKIMFAQHNIEVSVADIDEEKLKIAKSYGADHLVQWERKVETPEQYQAEIGKTKKNGSFDAAVDFVGATSSFTIGFQSLSNAGTIVQVGLFGGRINLPLLEVTAKQIHIQGNLVGSLSDLKELVQFVERHKIEYPAIEYATLNDINEIHNRLRNGKVKGRVLLKFNTE